MPHSMPTNINFSVEPSTANFAGEGFNTSMPPHVCKHVRRLTENLSTLLTLKWLHPSVHQRMLFHVGFAEEIFSAVTA